MYNQSTRNKNRVIIVYHTNIREKFNQSGIEKIDAYIAILDKIFEFVVHVSNTKEALLLSVMTSQEQAIYTQLQNIRENAETNEDKAFAARKLSELVAKYQDRLPQNLKYLLEKLHTEIIEILPLPASKSQKM